jgi:tRNA(fMet)-specific endonuclease VapC
MLDTNTLSDILREPQGPAVQHLARCAPHSICTSAIVACEMRFGAARKKSASLTRKVEAMLAALPVLPFDEAASQHYAQIRQALEARGTPIGSHDLFIAAHARALGLTLVTRNRSEFSRVPGLGSVAWD